MSLFNLGILVLLLIGSTQVEDVRHVLSKQESWDFVSKILGIQNSEGATIKGEKYSFGDGLEIYNISIFSKPYVAQKNLCKRFKLEYSYATDVELRPLASNHWEQIAYINDAQSCDQIESWVTLDFEERFEIPGNISFILKDLDDWIINRPVDEWCRSSQEGELSKCKKLVSELKKNNLLKLGEIKGKNIKGFPNNSIYSIYFEFYRSKDKNLIVSSIVTDKNKIIITGIYERNVF